MPLNPDAGLLPLSSDISLSKRRRSPGIEVPNPKNYFTPVLNNGVNFCDWALKKDPGNELVAAVSDLDIGQVLTRGAKTKMAAALRLGNAEITPAVVDGQPCVFSNAPFTLCRKRWVPDNEVSICPICQQKFTQIRRKHHCRQCGRVLCSKCCENKMLLPQLGYEEEAQKICDECLPISQLISKAKSLQFAKKEEAAKGLNQMIKDYKLIQKVIELGGVQTFIYLSQSINEDIKENVADALHMLSTHVVLHPLLVQAGAIKAICSLLSSEEKLEKTLIDSVSTLMLFCKSENYKKQAVAEGALKPILILCGMKETIALLAVTTLSLLADHEENLYTLVEKEKEALPKIMNLVKASDEKMQEIALKILCSLSLGTDWHRHRIVQEHYTNGKCLVNVFSKIPGNQQVLVNGACLLGNLASCENDQAVLRECLELLCELVKNSALNRDVQAQLSRCMANYSKYKVNFDLMVQFVNDVVQQHLQTDDTVIQLHGIKAILNLLKHDHKDVLSCLNKEELDAVWNGLLVCPGMMEAITKCLGKNVPEKNRPMSL